MRCARVLACLVAVSACIVAVETVEAVSAGAQSCTGGSCQQPTARSRDPAASAGGAGSVTVTSPITGNGSGTPVGFDFSSTNTWTGPNTFSGALSMSSSCVAHQWVTASPTLSCAQPAFADISGTAIAAQVPSLDAGKITTGIFAAAQIPSIDASKVTTGTFAAAQIPALDASKITTGVLPVANGGTGAATANNVTVFAGPPSGGPLPGSFLALTTAYITSGTFGTGFIPALDASKITTGTFGTGLIPALDAGKITTGVLVQARGGTGSGALTCSAGTHVTSNGTAQSCSADAPLNASAATDSFGATVSTTATTVLSVVAPATGNYFISGTANVIAGTNGDSVLVTLSVNAGASLTGASQAVSATDPFNGTNFAVPVQAVAALTSGDTVRLKVQGGTTAATVGAASLVILRVN